MWLIFLVIAVSLAIITLVIVNRFSNVFYSTPFFQTSFSEGNSLSSITIVSKNQIAILDNHQFLQSKVTSSVEGTVVYHLTSINFDLLRELQENVQENNELLSAELRR